MSFAQVLRHVPWFALLPAGALVAAEGDFGLDEAIQEFVLAPPAWVQQEGEWQLGAGASRLWQDDDGENEYEFAAEYGFTDAWQGSLGMEGNEDEDVSAWELGTSYRFIRREDTQALFSLTATREEQEDEDTRWWTAPGVIVGHAIGKGQVHVHLGGAFSEGDSVLLYDVAGLYPVSDTAMATLELNAQRAGEENHLYVTPGVRYQPAWASGLEVGLGIPVGLESEAADHGVVLQLVVTPGG